MPRRLPDPGIAELAEGFLPGVYQGTHIDTQHTKIEKLIEHIKNNYTSLPEQRSSSICCSS